MQKLILHMTEDQDIKHRCQLIVKAFGTLDELCKIRDYLSEKGFGINAINDDTMFLSDNMQCWERIKELDTGGCVWQETWPTPEGNKIFSV